MISTPAETFLDSRPESQAAPAGWLAALSGAMAGGMAWGIRGQYGHETGAMIAGLLVSLVLVLLFCPSWPAAAAARAVALGTIAMGFGGSMTYGQTVGLTHDAVLVGHISAWQWGMLGLAIKGGIWIGFAGLFLGIGLGGRRYSGYDMLVMMALALGLYLVGRQLLNEPFDPANKVLPRLYFSADWRWQPKPDLKPRLECWGGLLFALAGLTALVATWKKDALAWRLAGWGCLGGAVGFPAGQSIQAWHAWHPEFFRAGFLARIAPVINWWNMMETTFGAIMGAALGLGLWLHRRRVAISQENDRPALPVAMEGVALVLFLGVLTTVEFGSVPWLDRFFDLGLAMGLLPMVMVAAGRWWPFLVVLPITLLPIAGKTVRHLAYDEKRIEPMLGLLVYLVVPLVAASVLAWWSLRRAEAGEKAGTFSRRTLLVSVWLYFSLNFGFFHFPWPWAKWTARTPNAMIFLACAVGLTLVALSRKEQARESVGQEPANANKS